MGVGPHRAHPANREGENAVNGFASNERGAVLAEFALVVSTLFFLLMMCFEVGMILNAQLVLSSAAREGGRQAAVDGGYSPAVQSRVDDLLGLGGLLTGDLEMTVQPRQAAYGRPIDVRLVYPYRVRSGLLQRVIPSIIDLEARVITRSERLDD